MSDCNTDFDCEVMYKEYVDFVVLSNHANELYNDYYE